MPVPNPPGGEQSTGAKPRRVAGWVLLAVGALILGGLLVRLLNQQRTSNETPDIAAVERTQPESAPVPGTEARPSDTTRGNDAGIAKPKTAPTRVAYMVTHKHRLRDCHGTLTFTRNGLRFDSDEPQDSFDVRRDDVTINGDVLRIRDKAWRFEFKDGVQGDRLFSAWKAGTLSPVTAP
jgi:hypothetical protein